MIPIRTDFSIIVPVFNCKDYIQSTIESILKFAPEGNFELIVIDDGSNDGTSEILNGFGTEITIFRQENAGEAASVNLGLQHASGKFALVVSADDPLMSSDLFKMAERVFNQQPQIIVVYPDWQLINSEGKVVRKVTTQEYSFETMLGRSVCIPGPGSVFKLDVAKAVGGRNPDLKYGSDFDFWLRISKFGDFQRIPMTLAQWRMHDNSTSIRLRGPAMARERVSIITDFLQTVSVPRRLHRISMGNAYYSAAVLRYFHPDVPHRQLLLSAFKSRRGWIENARVREVFYLLTLPFSEKLWKVLKRFFGLGDPQR